MSCFIPERLVFGTARLHRVIDFRKRAGLIESAYGFGVRRFDTAPSYGMGLAECLIGEVLGAQSDILVNTKVGIITQTTFTRYSLEVFVRKAICRTYLENLRSNFTYESMQRSFDGSLRRLKRDRVNTLFFHEPVFSLLNPVDIIKFIESNRERFDNIGVAGEWEVIKDSYEMLIALGIKTTIQTNVDALKSNINYSVNYIYGIITKTTKREELTKINSMKDVNILYSALNKERIQHYHRNVF